MIDDFESIFSISDENNNHHTLRRMRASNALDLSKPHLLLKGRVSFVNSFGFLNADQFTMLRFNMIMFVTFLLANVIWVRWMRLNKDNVITIHWYLFALLCATCIECASTFLEYDMYNNTGHRNVSFLVFNVIFSACRNSLARLIALLISLGYGIVMNVLTRYLTKIGLLTFLYFVANALNLACFYINQHRPLSTSLRVALALPEGLLNLLFLIWIVFSLLRTLAYLKSKNQHYKFHIMKMYAVIVAFGTLGYLLINSVAVGYNLMGSDDEVWRAQHWLQIAFQINFTLMLFATCYIFRPLEGTKVLAEVDEFLDETLTEIGPVDGELSRRVDSVEYAQALQEKMQARESVGVINYEEQNQQEMQEHELVRKAERK